MIKKKKIPLRKCIGCQEQKEKKDLVRILRQEDGSLIVDTTGKLNGRGAYVCRNAACLEAARKNRGLERSFKCSIDKGAWDILAGEIKACEE